MAEKRNIFLIGPMGAGKSTIGRHLADELHMEFFDSDQEIERRTGADIAWVFDIEGEEGFRRREESVINELIVEMNNASESVAASTVTIGAVTKTTVNTNTGTIILSKKLSGIDAPSFFAGANREYAGLDSQLSLTSDSIRVFCNFDSEQDGSSLGQERFTITGKPPAPLPWPIRGR